ncbi:MAG: O-antigen ligase family protein [Sporolactobacillus sp.]
MKLFEQLGQSIKKQPLLWGIALLFVLPPVGMAWLLILAFASLIATFKKRQKLTIDLIAILLLAITAASLVVTLLKHGKMAFFSTLMMIGYSTVYLFLSSGRTAKLNVRLFAWIGIAGGLYITVSDKFFAWIMHIFVHLPNGLLLLDGNLLLGFRYRDRLFGSAYNPNYACYLLILALALLFVEWLCAIRKAQYRIIWLFALFALILDYGIYDTGSRAGFAIMLGLHLLFLLFYRKWLFVGLAILAGVLTPVIIHLMPRANSTHSSLVTRQDIWGNSLHVFFKHPWFGTTAFGFPHAYKAVAGSSQSHPHNIFLAIFASSGVICGLLFLLLLAAGVYWVFAALYHDGVQNYNAQLYLFALPTIIAYGMMDFTLSSPQIMLVVLALCAFWSDYLKRLGLLQPVGSLLLPRLFGKNTNRSDTYQRQAAARFTDAGLTERKL